MSTIIQHPSACLLPEQVTLIRSFARTAEEAGQLTEEQVSLAVQQRWFTMLAPAVYNGDEKPLPEVVRLEEAIAWADGSMGWVVTLCSGAGWFGGFMNTALANIIFTAAEACLAGSGAATGIAEKTEDGYRVSGKWWYASGTPHNTVFTANCKLVSNGVPLTGDNGEPLVKAFAFFRSEVEIIPTWQSFGLVATASHAFEVKELSVPENRLFTIDASEAITKRPLYQYPFLQLAEVTLAANLSGMALHFMEEAILLIVPKSDAEPGVEHETFKNECLAIEKCRQSFYAALDTSWQQQMEGNVTEALLQQVSETARGLAAQSRIAVERVYPFCGMAAADKQTEINRVWRDLHTASQHNLLAYPRK